MSRNRIRDDLTRLKISRQLKYQRRMTRRGRCRVCGGPQFLNKRFCRDHYVKIRLTRIGIFEGGINSAWRVRKQPILSYASGLVYGQEHGTSAPHSGWEHIAEIIVRHLFGGRKPQRDGKRLVRLARWLWRWELRLRRDG